MYTNRNENYDIKFDRVESSIVNIPPELRPHGIFWNVVGAEGITTGPRNIDSRDNPTIINWQHLFPGWQAGPSAAPRRPVDYFKVLFPLDIIGQAIQ